MAASSSEAIAGSTASDARIPAIEEHQDCVRMLADGSHVELAEADPEVKLAYTQLKDTVNMVGRCRLTPGFCS